MSTPSWMAGAACADTDPNLFFNGGGPVPSVIRKMCEACPEREQCLDYALRHNVDGAWAGTSKIERDRLRELYDITAEPLILDLRDLTDMPAEPAELVAA